MQSMDLGSLRPEIDLAVWMDADSSLKMLDNLGDDDPSDRSPTTVWI